MRLCTVLLYALITTGAASGDAPVRAACIKLNKEALALVVQGRAGDAENLLSAVLVNGDQLDPVCAGITMNNVAALLSRSGRESEAESMAKRAVQALEQSFPPDDPTLMRPLQILAMVEIERGKIARAREALKRMQAIPTPRPEARELVYATAAALDEAEGRLPEAESQYSAAMQALKEAGRGDSGDAAVLLNSLGGAYIKEHRLVEARQMLNEALRIFERTPDTDPWDRVKLLRVRGALCGREGEWRQAEEDLAKALSIAYRESRVEPVALRTLLMDYAAVLRRNHQWREARSIERRIAALGSVPEDRVVVDVSDLLPQPKTPAEAHADLRAAGDVPGTHTLFDLTTPQTAPFPGDNFTLSDPGQLTDLRVADRAGTARRTTTRFCPPDPLLRGAEAPLNSGNPRMRQEADSTACRKTK